MGSAGAGIAILPNTSNGLGAWIAGLLIVSGLLVIGSFIAMKLYAKLADKK